MEGVWLRFGILTLCCVALFTGVKAGSLTSKFCDTAREIPSIFMCRQDSVTVAMNQTLYLDATGAPDYTAVNCTCNIAISGTATVIVTYRSRDVDTCGITISVGGSQWGCEIESNAGVLLNAEGTLSYIKYDDTIEDWDSCLGLRSPTSSLSVVCFPSVPLNQTTSTRKTTTTSTPTPTTDGDQCASNPCEHGGVCTDGTNDFTCNCTAGYEGKTCQTDTDDCTSSPCDNGGTCVDAVNGFTCNCTAGFEGDTCQTDIDECLSRPCLNGANCTNIVNGYTCTCLPGFANDNCSEAVDECTSNPCLNGAACVDGLNSYSCSCADGFEGTNCGTNIDECASNSACLNGATCVDGINQFTCSCADGFEGDTCENSIEPVAGQLTVAEAGTNLGLIIGLVVGIIVLILIILIILLLVLRRRRDRRPKKTERSVSYTPSRGDVTVTENALYNYDGENPSEAVNALFIGGIPDGPGNQNGEDYIPHFKTDTGDRYAVIIDSTRSKPKPKERPNLPSFTDKGLKDDKEILITPESKTAPYDTLDSNAGKTSENGDVSMGVHNPGYEHEYLSPLDSRSMTLTSDKSDTYDYIDQAKLRMDDEVFEKEKGDYFKIQDGVIDKTGDDIGYSNNVSGSPSHVDGSLSRASKSSVSSNPDGGYMNASSTSGDYVNSPSPSGKGPTSSNSATSPSHDSAFTFE